MSYTIKVTYTTGDSYKTENGCISYVGAVWEDIEEARVALKYLAEHYHASKENHHRMKEFSNKPWYAKGDYPEFCLMVPVGGEMKQISGSTWLGYFERLEELEIVLYVDEDGNTPDKIKFGW